MESIAVVMGTRPEIIKLAGIVQLLGDSALVIHTGQHYDRAMSQIFLDELGLRAPDHVLALGAMTRAEQIGRGTEQLAHVFERCAPRAVVVQGDTNSALAGALAANAVRTPLVHVEAGLRSFDRAMPEEHNRVLIDHISDLLAAPTTLAVDNLAREGIGGAAVVRTGNTVIEAVTRQLPPPHVRARRLTELGLSSGTFVLATIHRPENTDDVSVLETILRQLAALPLPVVMPLHPRTAAAVAGFGASALLEGLRIIEPIGGAEFLGLAAEAALLVSDSGGVQEEVTVLGRPLVVVRNSTERPEALEHFAVMSSPRDIVEHATPYLTDNRAVLADLATRDSPFGDGSASRTIVDLIRTRFTVGCSRG